MNKILILKNDRVGDLFHSIKGINSIINQHKNHQIDLMLSNYSKDAAFLFNLSNIKISILNYNLNILDKFSIITKILLSNYEKIFILSPKNIYYYLPFLTNSKFYAITIKDYKRNRPPSFLIKKLHKFCLNNRVNKKKSESISNLIQNLCNEKNIDYPNLLNINPNISNILKINLSLFKNFIHIHYKHDFFKKNDWTVDIFLELINKISNKFEKIIITSDYGNYKHNDIFLKKLSFLNFNNETINLNKNSNILYLHNIKINDLFKIMSLSNQVISPHGTMTVMASFLKKKVVDLFDVNISLNSFREFKPENLNYKFLILKNNNQKIMSKIINFL